MRALGTRSGPRPTGWGRPSDLHHGARSCWGCGVAGYSPFWVSPKRREPLTLGVRALPTAWREAGAVELQASLAGMGWAVEFGTLDEEEPS